MAAKMDALVLTKSGSPVDNLEYGQVEKPTPGPDEVLVKVKFAAINPVDWKMAQYGVFFEDSFPTIIGCDMAGVVETVGDAVTSLKEGDNVWSFNGVGQKGRGVFAQYCVAKERFCGKIPENKDSKAMAGVGVPGLTAHYALYEALGYSRPGQENTHKRKSFLVWGGSSAVGQYTIQLLKLGGFRVITTASQRNFDLLKRLGADVAVDYHADNAVELLKEAAGDDLLDGFDTIGPKTAELCARVLKACGGGRLVTIAGSPEQMPEGVELKEVLMALADRPENPELQRWLEQGTAELTKWISEGKLKTVPVQEVDGGLKTGVKDALKLSAEGKVSAGKLVVAID